MVNFKFDNGSIIYGIMDNGKISEWYYNKSTITNENNQKTNIFYNYYKPENTDRYREIIYCLDQLLRNKLIDNIYILCSDYLYLTNDKIIKINIDGQPKYKNFIDIINFFSKENDINILINSDCYIDEKNTQIIIDNIKNNEAYLLSRWEILSLEPFEYQHFDIFHNDIKGCSQDAWIFIGKPKNGFNGDYQLGKAGCDNAIAYEFDKVGYKTLNPSKSIKIYHYHLSQIRTYGDIKERESVRVKLPYKFIPSTNLVNIEKVYCDKIVFYNSFHNGDIHYSREFIKDIMRKYKASYSYYFNNKHIKDNELLKDIENITITNEIPDEISNVDSITILDDIAYINTWVGQGARQYVDKYGINLTANYEIFKEIYKNLNIEPEPIDYYIPSINYDFFDTKNVDDFINKYNKEIKVLISNGDVFSAQCKNFDMNPIIDLLSNKYNDVIFITTQKLDMPKDNLFHTEEITKKQYDLNEISYLSTKCDIIVGRASGPYAFSMTKENLNNPNKTFICFCDDKKDEWYISNTCNHIISNNYEIKELTSIISNNIDLLLEDKKSIKIRIAFTIIFNGLHHLKHNDYANYIPKIFDYWIIVEGSVDNKGSTSWCKKMPDNYHNNGKSIDGTIEFLKELKLKYNNIIIIESDGMLESKDIMVNRAIEEIKKITNTCYLWQIDIDEQWTKEQIVKSEKELREKNGKTGEFNVIQFVGENLIVTGKDWAGIPFIRLWDWNGENFISHEPPILDNYNINKVLLSEEMKHYSFYFEEDVKFKDKWYDDHDGSYNRWLMLKKEVNFPIHITYLFPKFKGSKHLQNSNNLDSWIIRYNDKKIETPKIEPPKIEPPKIEPPKIEISKIEIPKIEQDNSDYGILKRYLDSKYDFILLQNGIQIFDSTNNKQNIILNKNYFEIYGRIFSYNGLRIKEKITTRKW